MLIPHECRLDRSLRSRSLASRAPTGWFLDVPGEELQYL